MTWIATFALIATVIPTMAAAAGDGCNSYGVTTQASVTGNNDYKCTYQACETGGAGAGSAGVGVGTAGGSGEAGAEASAGTGCEQSAGGSSSPACNGVTEPFIESTACRS